LLRVGGLTSLGLGLPQLLATRATAAQGTFGQAKACIVLFLVGGPPQHETWDPKPEAPADVRGAFGTISTSLPGLTVGELMPQTAKLAHRVSVLRAVSTSNNIHSTSGYWMLTGHEHPNNSVEVAGEFSPNDWPCFGAMVKQLRPARGGLPASVTLPEPIMNNPGILWPGQSAGFLGRQWDPWLLACDPSAKDFTLPLLSLPVDAPLTRLDERRSLLTQYNQRLDALERSELPERFAGSAAQAWDLLRGGAARQAFRLESEKPELRDRYGRHKFGQSCLLARRLVEAGVSLVQVNWPREAGDLQVGNPCWDTHQKNAERLKTALMPPMDQGYSALLEDLAQRGLLEETLVVWMAEFGRTPKINGAGGRDHWGKVFSVALAGGGIRTGCVYGQSDRVAGEPRDGLVLPQDLSATIFHCLGIEPHAALHDQQGRILAVSEGRPIEGVLA
jgi:hypothetical protein